MALSPQTKKLLWTTGTIAPFVLSIVAIFGLSSGAEAIKTEVWTKEDGITALTDRHYSNVNGGKIESTGCPGTSLFRFGRDYEATDVNGNQVQRRVCFSPSQTYVLER